MSAMFPLARVIAAVETVEEQRCYLLSQNQKLLTCEYGHHDLQCICNAYSLTNSNPGLPASVSGPPRNLGLKCLGPSRVVDNMISRLCPASATLGYDTALLKFQRASSTTTMTSRCITCQAEYLLECQLEKYGFKASNPDQICEKKECFRAEFGGSRFCKAHLSGWTQTQEDTELQQLQMLRNHISPALQVVWSDKPAMGSILALADSIRAGESQVSALRLSTLSITSLRGGYSK